jgi:hypothetical protein
VQGNPVTPAADGKFTATIQATPGNNSIEIVAIDIAGNETRRERRFVFMPDEQSTVRFDADIPSVAPRHFLSAVDTISLGGQTTANAQLQIRDGGRTLVAAATDSTGRFRLNMPLRDGTNQYEALVTAASGFSSADSFSVTVDRAVPEIALDSPPPRLTANTTITLAGRTKPGARLLLNGREIANRNGRFEESVALKDGVNAIELNASDAAGNVKTETWQVQQDSEPPVLVGSRIAPAAGGRPILMIEVDAKDDSGLAAVAPVKVTAGGRTLTAHLRFNRAARNYQGSLPVTAGAMADAKLSEIELTDDAGNKRVFQIN